MFTTEKEVVALVNQMDEAFKAQDREEAEAVLLTIQRDGGWGEKTPVGNVVQEVVAAYEEARQLSPDKWPPPRAATAHCLLAALGD